MTDPIYIISGFPRSGTSMMMRAVEAGGIPCVYSDDSARDKTANPHGYYELDDLHNADWTFFRGKCVKVLHQNLGMISVGERCRIAYMLRDPKEIAASFRTMNQCGPCLKNYAAETSQAVLSLISTGHDVRTLHFTGVIENPLAAFESMQWPIDARLASAVVDPSLYRRAA